VKMLNSGAPGVMLDLEDSMANQWDHLTLGIENILKALHEELTYFDQKRSRTVGIEPSKTVVWVRPRGLHISQAGIFDSGVTSASLFDVASVFYRIAPARLKHPLALYIPKSESAEEARWWRELLVDVCHKRGAFAIGGMTALFPSREDPELNARALVVLAQDKKNEATCLMDGAWTGHPDQNEIAVRQFPSPNQVQRRPALSDPHPDLRPLPRGVGTRSLQGTRAAVRTVIRYRNGVLNGRGASLLDGYMEDQATDRIYRLMIAQRLRH